ncbi:hypothetical protein BEP19_13040 [Ammoniphilus oxalaticus]|uniref:VOC domain-containing protein n=1 Tax=Ammoniphilus oxalaticus TaxID=66863 RepID=A0A419SH80_9BACL|nr:VOC family protein [Ammoniphilus oxalaticus]RKD23137.1 hypothetical protein BEP19_13040 [Ammoniphilus oxalaticus]
MIKGIEHVGILVPNMDQAIAFYQEAFGLSLRRRESLNAEVELAFLTFADQPNVEVELIAGPGVEHNGAGLIDHLAFRVEGIELEIERLKKLGAEPIDLEPRVILGDVKIAFLKGPHGEKLELVERS